MSAYDCRIEVSAGALKALRSVGYRNVSIITSPAGSWSGSGRWVEPILGEAKTPEAKQFQDAYVGQLLQDLSE